MGQFEQWIKSKFSLGGNLTEGSRKISSKHCFKIFKHSFI